MFRLAVDYVLGLAEALGDVDVLLFAIGRVIGSVPPSADLQQRETSEQAAPVGREVLVPLPEPAGSEEFDESAQPGVRGGGR